MKKVITIVAAMVFVFAIGSVFADDLAFMKDGIEGAPAIEVYAPSRDFGHPRVSDALYDVGTMLYISAFETKSAEEVIGAAAGGVAKEDENTRIWDNLMPRGVTLE
jgi:hypothetical protein